MSIYQQIPLNRLVTIHS